MMSNLEIVDRAFIDQFVATYEALFVKDPNEFTTYVDFSAAARRVYSRWKREIPLLSRTGELLIVTPKTGEIRKETISTPTSNSCQIGNGTALWSVGPLRRRGPIGLPVYTGEHFSGSENIYYSAN